MDDDVTSSSGTDSSRVRLDTMCSEQGWIFYNQDDTPPSTPVDDSLGIRDSTDSHDVASIGEDVTDDFITFWKSQNQTVHERDRSSSTFYQPLVDNRRATVYDGNLVSLSKVDPRKPSTLESSLSTDGVDGSGDRNHHRDTVYQSLPLPPPEDGGAQCGVPPPPRSETPPVRKSLFQYKFTSVQAYAAPGRTVAETLELINRPAAENDTADDGDDDAGTFHRALLHHMPSQVLARIYAFLCTPDDARAVSLTCVHMRRALFEPGVASHLIPGLPLCIEDHYPCRSESVGWLAPSKLSRKIVFVAGSSQAHKAKEKPSEQHPTPNMVMNDFCLLLDHQSGATSLSALANPRASPRDIPNPSPSSSTTSLPSLVSSTSSDCITSTDSAVSTAERSPRAVVEHHTGGADAKMGSKSDRRPNDGTSTGAFTRSRAGASARHSRRRKHTLSKTGKLSLGRNGTGPSTRRAEQENTDRDDGMANTHRLGKVKSCESPPPACDVPGDFIVPPRPVGDALPSPTSHKRSASPPSSPRILSPSGDDGGGESSSFQRFSVMGASVSSGSLKAAMSPRRRRVQHKEAAMDSAEAGGAHIHHEVMDGFGGAFGAVNAIDGTEQSVHVLLWAHQKLSEDGDDISPGGGGGGRRRRHRRGKSRERSNATHLSTADMVHMKASIRGEYSKTSIRGEYSKTSTRGEYSKTSIGGEYSKTSIGGEYSHATSDAKPSLVGEQCRMVSLKSTRASWPVPSSVLMKCGLLHAAQRPPRGPRKALCYSGVLYVTGDAGRTSGGRAITVSAIPSDFLGPRGDLKPAMEHNTMREDAYRPPMMLDPSKTKPRRIPLEHTFVDIKKGDEVKDKYDDEKGEDRDGQEKGEDMSDQEKREDISVQEMDDVDESKTSITLSGILRMAPPLRSAPTPPGGDGKEEQNAGAHSGGCDEKRAEEREHEERMEEKEVAKATEEEEEEGKDIHSIDGELAPEDTHTRHPNAQLLSLNRLKEFSSMDKIPRLSLSPTKAHSADGVRKADVLAVIPDCTHPASLCVWPGAWQGSLITTTHHTKRCVCVYRTPGKSEGDNKHACGPEPRLRASLLPSGPLLLLVEQNIHKDDDNSHETHSHETHSHETHSHETHSHETHSGAVHWIRTKCDVEGLEGHTHGQEDGHTHGRLPLVKGLSALGNICAMLHYRRTLFVAGECGVICVILSPVSSSTLLSCYRSFAASRGADIIPSLPVMLSAMHRWEGCDEVGEEDVELHGMVNEFISLLGECMGPNEPIAQQETIPLRGVQCLVGWNGMLCVGCSEGMYTFDASLYGPRRLHVCGVFFKGESVGVSALTTWRGHLVGSLCRTVGKERGTASVLNSVCFWGWDNGSIVLLRQFEAMEHHSPTTQLLVASRVLTANQHRVEAWDIKSKKRPRSKYSEKLGKLSRENAHEDDSSSAILTFTIVRTEKVKIEGEKSFVVYVLLIKGKMFGDITIKRRYNEMLDLHHSLKQAFKGTDLPKFPGKKRINNKSSEYVSYRAEKFKRYFAQLTQNKEIAESKTMMEWINRTDACEKMEVVV